MKDWEELFIYKEQLKHRELMNEQVNVFLK